MKNVSRTMTTRTVAPRPAMRRTRAVPSVVVKSAATDEIVEKLKDLTLLEASELVKSIEETFGVDASAPVGGGMMMAAPGAGGGDAGAAEEKTDFTLQIVEVDASKRIAAIKVVRSLTSLGLKEAKDAVTNLPFDILKDQPKEACEEAQKQLEEQGCKCAMV
ncbi:ribosomal protein L7/L12 [Pycnococcus provasolii]